jgi:hypothetical protein
VGAGDVLVDEAVVGCVLLLWLWGGREEGGLRRSVGRGVGGGWVEDWVADAGVEGRG